MRQVATVGGATTRFVVDAVSDEIVALLDSAGAVVSSFVRDAAGALVAMVRSGAVLTYLTNAHGDVTALVDAAGAVVARWTYDAWGNPTEYDAAGNQVATGTAGNPFLYAGYLYDVATGLYYLRARYYDPATGRFLSMDPEPGALTDRLSQNPYIYCQNDPVNLADPDGRAVVQGTGVGPRLTARQRLQAAMLRARRIALQKARRDAAKKEQRVAGQMKQPAKTVGGWLAQAQVRVSATIMAVISGATLKKGFAAALKYAASDGVGSRGSKDTQTVNVSGTFGWFRVGSRETTTADPAGGLARSLPIKLYGEGKMKEVVQTGELVGGATATSETELLGFAGPLDDNLSLKSVTSLSTDASVKSGTKVRVWRGQLQTAGIVGAQGAGVSAEPAWVVLRDRPSGVTVTKSLYLEMGLSPTPAIAVAFILFGIFQYSQTGNYEPIIRGIDMLDGQPDGS